MNVFYDYGLPRVYVTSHKPYERAGVYWYNPKTRILKCHRDQEFRYSIYDQGIHLKYTEELLKLSIIMGFRQNRTIE